MSKKKKLAGASRRSQAGDIDLLQVLTVQATTLMPSRKCFDTTVSSEEVVASKKVDTLLTGSSVVTFHSWLVLSCPHMRPASIQ